MASVLSFLRHLPWITAFGLFGNIISFLVYLSPIPTFYKIYKKKSTEGFQCIPYTVALFSAMLWIFYAFFATNSTFLITINSFGCIIEALYIALFLFFATKEARAFTLKLILLTNVLGFGAIVFVVLVIAKSNHLRMKILGWLCLTLAFLVFVAPLGVMRQVIRTKSVKYMPFFLSFFLTISAVMWFFYGLLKKDYFVAIPNVLGFLFGIAQMIIYFIYKNCEEIILEEEKEDPKGQKLPQFTSEQVIREVVNLNPTIVVRRQENNSDRSVAMATMPDGKDEGFHTVEV
ncbi:hypothetical protein Ancab_035538 [Ancistrocladus abbreviatus]